MDELIEDYMDCQAKQPQMISHHPLLSSRTSVRDLYSPLLSPQYLALRTQHSALSTQHSALSFYPVLLLRGNSSSYE